MIGPGQSIVITHFDRFTSNIILCFKSGDLYPVSDEQRSFNKMYM